MAKYTAPPTIFALSKVFQHGKTQVPKDVRQTLQIEDGDKILWYTQEGKIFVKKAE